MSSIGRGASTYEALLSNTLATGPVGGYDPVVDDLKNTSLENTMTIKR